MNRLETHTTATFENWTVHSPVPFDRIEKNPLSEREIQILAYVGDQLVGAKRFFPSEMQGPDVHLTVRIW